MFKTSQSGVTYKAGPGSVAMYKTFTSRDYILWQAGFNLTWRDNENSCPTGWAPGASARPAAQPASAPHRVSTGPDSVNTLVFFYTWPANQGELTYGGRPARAPHTSASRLSILSTLAASGLLTPTQEAEGVDGVLGGDDAVLSLIDVYGSDGQALAGHLTRHLARIRRE